MPQINDSDIETVKSFCETNLDLKYAKLGDEYFYNSLSLCVIDAVFSIGVKYEATQNVVRRYAQYFNLKQIRDKKESIPNIEEQESIETFLKNMEQIGTETFTNEIFRNRQRTSPTNGILKTEAAYRYATIFSKYGINYFQDVHKIMFDSDFENEIKNIPGQRSGISLKYFFMLAGSDDYVKTDRMIIRFLENILNRKINLDEVQTLIFKVSDRLNTKYNDMNPRLLDHQIWNYQRG